MWHVETADRHSQMRLQLIVDQQQRNEQNMAEKLAKAFDEDMAVMGCLRGLVANAMEDIQWITVTAGEGPFRAAMLKDAINYRWVREKYNIKDRRHLTEQQLKDLLEPHCTDFHGFLTARRGANAFSMGAYQCADLIRFYGEVLEACEEHFKANEEGVIEALETLSEDQKKTYPGTVAAAAKLVKRAKSYQLGPKPQWQKKGVGAERGRILGQLGLNRDEKWDDSRWSETLDRSEKAKIIREYVKKRTTTELRIAKMRGGASLWVQTPPDRVAKVDKVFGLAHAATISGTTTDNVFFYNRMSLVDRYLGEDVPETPNPALDKFLKKHYAIQHAVGIERNSIIDPIFYIIPLGAIVGAGHHSTIECAFPLALNKIINYTIKNYSTLFPLARKQHSVGGGGRVKAVMTEYEARADNRKLLIYYDSSGNYAGYVEFERGKDDALWKDIARADQTMLNKFSAFTQYPTKEQVGSLHPHVRKAMEPAPDVPRPRRGSLGTDEQQQKFARVKGMWEDREARNRPLH